MKKLFFIAIVATMLSSCAEGIEIIENISEKDMALVTVSFAGEHSPPLKSSMNTFKAEEWEKELKSITVLAFKQNGECVLNRRLTKGEIAARTVTIPLPRVSAGELVKFHAVANFSLSRDLMDLSYIEELISDSPAEYNNSYAKVSTQSVRSEGFAMSGNTEKIIELKGEKTPVVIGLKRMVSKIRIKTNITNEFRSKYNNQLIMGELYIAGSSYTTYVADRGIPFAGEPKQLIMQEPFKTGNYSYESLFYVFETGKYDGVKTPKIMVTALYDLDGIPAHRVLQTYLVDLNIDPQGEGIIRRNVYYDVVLNINGLAVCDVEVSVSTGDWEGAFSSKYEIYE